MPITNEQRERRRGYLGASDIPAILGVNPWRSSYDVFLEKTQKLDQDESPGDARDIGTRLEPFVIDWAEEQLGPLTRNVELISRFMPWMMVHLDAQVIETKHPVEAKTGGLLSILDKDTPGKCWGEPGTDEVPDYVAVQCYGQMFVAEQDTCIIPAFLGGRGFNLYSIHRDEEVMKEILDKCARFWEECVLKNIPPDDSFPSLDIVKRIQREPGPAVELPDGLVADWLAAKEAEKIAKSEMESLQAKVIAILGDGEEGICSQGRITYKSQHRSGYTVEPCDYRVLRIGKPKTK